MFSKPTLFTKPPLAVVSVINDLASDNRVRRTAAALQKAGFEVLLIGRRLSHSPVPDLPYKIRRMRLPVNKGPVFYLLFNLRLFWKLLFSRAELFFANDLDTLLPNFLVSRLRSIPLIYDSHELFCEVPELKDSPLKRRIWLGLERFIVPRLSSCITVNESIAGIYGALYGKTFRVVRNISSPPSLARVKSRAELDLPENKRIVLLQGAGINIDRGAEELIDSMEFLEDTFLLIIGSGDVWNELTKRATRFPGKVRLIKRIPPVELRHFTLNADLGVSIDKCTNLNYVNSLPNKIFDYMSAGLPVLATRLPEVEKVLQPSGCAVFIENHEPSHIAAKIREALDKQRMLRENALKASLLYSWENEEKVLLSVIQQARSTKV